MIELDLHETYGIDLADEDLLRCRSWAWLRLRIIGLLSSKTRLYRQFAPTPEGR